MSFKKFNSIENHYQEKFIQRWVDHNPEMLDDTYILTQKIHGANFQISFFPDGQWKIGKRSNWIDEGEKFYRVHEVIERINIDKEFFKLIEFARSISSKVTLYGEYFGNSVQKGVNYNCPDHDIKFFILTINDEQKTPKYFYNIMDGFGLQHWVLRYHKMVNGLQEALDFDVETFLTPQHPVEDNFAEGIVILPWHNIYTDGESYFMIKKKHSKFNEKAKSKKKPKINDFPEAVIKWNEEFKLYCTQNRLDGIFSKEGEIQEPKEISQYIGFMLNDMKDDFMKDHKEEVLSEVDPKDMKRIFNVGSMIVVMLQKCL